MSTLQSSSIAELMPALIKAKLAFKPALKDSTNPAFKSKYSSLDSVIEAIDEALLSNGLACVQQTDIDGGETILMTRFIHSSGEWIGSAYRVKPVQATPQGEGSALTYARRYALLALAGIAPEDDDGQAGSQPSRTQPRPTNEKSPDQDVTAFQAQIAAASNLDDLKQAAIAITAAGLNGEQQGQLRGEHDQRRKELIGEPDA